MFRHVRRVPARGRVLAQRFRHRADVVRPGAATHALVVHPQRQCLPGELGDLIAVARQVIQRGGKGAIRDTVAARVGLGWTDVAMMCNHEMDVPGGQASCIRVLMLVNTDKKPHELERIYLRGATYLRSRSGHADKAEP